MRNLNRAIILLGMVAGTFVHMAAHLQPGLWPLNDAMVDELHRAWHNKV